MAKWHVMAAAAALSLLAACSETQVARKGDKLPVHGRTHVAQATQRSTPWMQVMQRFGALRGTSSDDSLTGLLRVAKTPEISRGSVVRSAQSESEAELAARSRISGVPLDSLAAKVAQRLGARLHTKFAGVASFYSHPEPLASGGRFVPEGFTAAHRTLPFGTRLRVTDPKSGRSVVVVVNDRGPYVGGRVLDLSLGAARALGMTERGVLQVTAEAI